MIEEITEFNVTPEVLNMTKFEQISAVSQEPYFVYGSLFIFAVVLFLWFILSFQRVHKGSSKICFGSWINTKALIFILIAAFLYIFIFIFPIPTYWIS